MADVSAAVTISTPGSTLMKGGKVSPFSLSPSIAEAAAVDQSPFEIYDEVPADVTSGGRTAAAPTAPTAAGQGGDGSAAAGSHGSHNKQQQQQATTSTKQQKKVSFSAKLFSCMPCVGGPHRRVADEGRAFSDDDVARSDQQMPRRRQALSPRNSLRLMKQGSAAYSDADWYDARSEFSSALNGASSDQQAKLEELAAMLKDGTHLAHSPVPHALTHIPSTGPHIPNPPLAFAEPGLVFIPVPAVTGFAAYWERDPERSTGHPSPIDIMMGASMIAQRSHASIPGIWLQETASSLTMVVKPRFLPPGLPRYTETYDKSNATEPSWNLRRDLRLGSTSGQLFMTACGMLIMRATSRPMWGSGPDYVAEEYMRLEEGGEVIVDRMCCMNLSTGARATQYIVGWRHDTPPRGHV